MVEDKDFLILNGTVDLESASPVEWKLDIPIQYRVLSTFETICTVRMIDSCTNDGTNCYCTSQIGTKYNFIFNRTANLAYSGATMRAVLARYNTTGPKYATVIIPVVHESEVVNLTISNEIVNHTSCKLNLTQDTNYVHTLSTRNLKNPILSMQFGSNFETLHTVNNHTITYTIKTPLNNTDQIYTYNYTDDCKRSQSYSCLVKYIPRKTTEPSTSSTLKIGLGVGLGLGLPLLIILIIVVVWSRCPISFCKNEDSCFGKKHTSDISSNEKGRQLQSTNKSSDGNGTTKNQASTNENYNESAIH
ncbi:uncharacterized protein LOC131958400 isoform X2 [Physella acuta]|uniref:uncharacterized protein LOC131958400 isoform X2 n=1 Tax=Physella acuta TaxID=109671 RepID=UPI0027DD6A92|nr:uncharacterized protein LOC131958400 isoform X2 [Physella acuta]